MIAPDDVTFKPTPLEQLVKDIRDDKILHPHQSFLFLVLAERTALVLFLRALLLRFLRELDLLFLLLEVWVQVPLRSCLEIVVESVLVRFDRN